MPGFWDAFGPAFAATLLGVLGALVVGYGLFRITERHEREEHRVQRMTAIQALRRALIDNSNVFAALSKGLEEGETPLDTYLDSGTWDAVREQIAPQLQDYQVLADISAYYASVAVLGRLYDRFLDLTMGTAATLSDAPAQRERLQVFLSGRMQQLKGDADQIVNQLDVKRRPRSRSSR